MFFDPFCRVKLSEDKPSSSPRFSDEDNYRLFEQQLESLLIRGLGDRAHLVRVIRRRCSSGWLFKEGLLKLGKGDVWAGISLVNLDAALRMADVGPSADNKEEVILLCTSQLNISETDKPCTQSCLGPFG